MRLYRRLVFGNLLDLECARYAAVPLAPGVRRRHAGAVSRGSRSRSHDRRRRTGEVAVRQPGHRARTVDGARSAGADLRTRQRRAIRHGQVGRLHGVAATALHATQGHQGSKSHRPVRRRAHALGSRPEARLREPEIGDCRRGVHEHVDHVRRGRHRRAGELEPAAREQSAHHLSQREARLHRLHRVAGDDARGLQDSRQGDDGRSCRCALADRSSSRPGGREASKRERRGRPTARTDR